MMESVRPVFMLIVFLPLLHGFLLGGSCQGRCGSNLNKTASCQCNDHCRRFNDCCSDYTDLCDNGRSPGGFCDNITNVSQALWSNDVNRLHGSDLTVNYQPHITDNTLAVQSGHSLFTRVNEVKLTSLPTYTTFLALLNNYVPDKGQLEVTTVHEQTEIDAFLDAVLQTKVMATLLKFLTCKGIVQSQSQLRATLTALWFDLYSRSSKGEHADTCGFEHVFVGEYKGSSVNGFHNWLSFYEEEKEGRINYYGYFRRRRPSLVSVAFAWNSHEKPVSSFFLGTSPELELALYTLCALTTLDHSCTLKLDGSDVSFRIIVVDGHLATAYPDF